MKKGLIKLQIIHSSMNVQNLLIIIVVLFNSINNISDPIINVNMLSQSEVIQIIAKYEYIKFLAYEYKKTFQIDENEINNNFS